MLAVVNTTAPASRLDTGLRAELEIQEGEDIVNRRGLPGIVLVLFSALLLCSCSQQPWVDFTSEAGAFSVLLPQPPEEQTAKVVTDAGELDLNLFVTETDENIAYFVGYTDYPTSTVSRSDPYEVLAGAREATVRAQGGKTRTHYRLTLSGHPGIEFLADIEVGGRAAVLWARNFLVDSRLYQIFTMFYLGREPFDEIEQFFHSFRVLSR
jgi:hypothetical protein